jgi:RNA polymerase sigma factor (sigma-70 family)
MTNHEADQALVRRMLRGEEDAFEMFFDWMFPRVYRFALARVGGREDVAEDITQAAFCQGIRRLETWRGEASLFTWICTICRREVEAWRSAHPGADIHLIEDTPEIRAALEVLCSDEPLAADQMIQHRGIGARGGVSRREAHVHRSAAAVQVPRRLEDREQGVLHAPALK